MKEYTYTLVVERAPEGGYNVLVPAIPEICTFGQTMAEAREMARHEMPGKKNLRETAPNTLKFSLGDTEGQGRLLPGRSTADS